MVLLDTLAAGGAERVAVDLACRVDRTAYDPHVVATKRGGPLEEQLLAAGVPCTVLGRRRRTSVRPTLRALRLAQESDLIHSHLFGNNVWGALLAQTTGVPLLAHEHNRARRHTPELRRIRRSRLRHHTRSSPKPLGLKASRCQPDRVNSNSTYSLEQH
jgi:hypothetical protein